MGDIRDIWDELDPDGPPRFVARPPAAGAVVVLLGAFDPPTSAHLSIIEAAAAATGRRPLFCMTKRLLARPAGTLLDPARRLDLLADIGRERAIGVAVSNRGTYIDVHTGATAAGLDALFVIGADKLAQLRDPAFYPDGSAGADATMAEVGFVVVRRGGAEIPEGMAVLDDAFPSEQDATISASDVRARIGAGRPIDGLVPPLVADALRGYTERTERG